MPDLAQSLAGNDVYGKATYVSVLNAPTGDEYAFRIDYTVNKATSGNDYGLRVNKTDIASPGTSYPIWFGVAGTEKFSVDDTGILKTANAAYGGVIVFGTDDPNRRLTVASGEIIIGAALNVIRMPSSAFTCESGDYNHTVEAFKWHIRPGHAHTSGLLYNFQHLAGDSLFTIDFEGKIGVGVTPSHALSFSGQAAKAISLHRHATADTAGNSLTVRGGGATSGATNRAGGDVIVTPGLSTGTGESGVQIQGVPAGGSGTGDGTPATRVQVLGAKLGFHGVTPIARAVLATGAGATVDNVITALQNLGLVSQS